MHILAPALFVAAVLTWSPQLAHSQMVECPSSKVDQAIVCAPVPAARGKEAREPGPDPQQRRRPSPESCAAKGQEFRKLGGCRGCVIPGNDASLNALTVVCSQLWAN